MKTLIASENAGSGYRQIQGVLKTLGLNVSHVTVYNVLKRSDLDPAPTRGQLSNWQTFIQFRPSGLRTLLDQGKS